MNYCQCEESREIAIGANWLAARCKGCAEVVVKKMEDVPPSELESITDAVQTAVSKLPQA